ncbi:MAG TPA: FAD-dependent oxidoreductase [Baekduia sp.]|jgi:thioredoxin reductase (NADPH)|nr:FAD-dependent oxidoreductase [Baekduia sp.]
MIAEPSAHVPALMLVIEAGEAARCRIERELQRRYGADYAIAVERTAAAGLTHLEQARTDGVPVALVLGDDADVLAHVRALAPYAKRGLLIDWGGWGRRATADAVLQAMALGHVDYYVLRPWRSPDELFHRTVAEFLHEWSRTSGEGKELSLVADPWSPRGHQLRDLLTRNGVPHSSYDSDSASGRTLLRTAALAGEDRPVVVRFDGHAMVDPSNAELAAAYGVSTDVAGDRDFDVVIVGAGPGGLAAAVSAASEGLRTLVVERETLGGQAGSSSLIRNYLGFPRGVSGGELAQRAYQQAWVFGAQFVVMREVLALHAGPDRHVLELSDCSEVTAGAVVLAPGVSYRRLGVEALERYVGAGLYYGASVSEARAIVDRPVLVVGGGNSAGQAAIHLARHASHVSLIVRGTSLADSMSDYLVRVIDAHDGIDVRLESRVVGGAGEDRLERVTVREDRTGTESDEEVGGLFVLVGGHPHTGWLPDEVARDRWGYLLTGRHAAEDDTIPLPLPLETSVPGVFAVGDVRSRSPKRVASAVGEGSVVVGQIHERLSPAFEATR